MLSYLCVEVLKFGEESWVVGLHAQLVDEFPDLFVSTDGTNR